MSLFPVPDLMAPDIYAVEPRELRARGVRFGRLGERAFRVNRQVGAEVAVLRRDGVQDGLRQFDGRKRFRGKPFRRRPNRQLGDVHDSAPSTIFGRRNSFPWRSGAFASAASRSIDGRTVSSRNALTSFCP